MVHKATTIALTAVVVILCVSIALAAECPSSTKVLNCTPKCLHDSECSAIGGKCCRNICNGQSCAQSNTLKNSGPDVSRGSSGPFNKNSASGLYCGNVKCGPFEKCETDRSTKRPKCVRG